MPKAAGGRVRGAAGRVDDQLLDPPHAVHDRFGVVAELLGHPARAPADAELPDGATDRLRHLRAAARRCRVPDGRAEAVLEIAGLQVRAGDRVSAYSLGMK